MGTPPPVLVANIGMADTVILMILALVVFGPRKLPQIGRQIGKLMYEFRKASNDFKFQMEEELRQSEEADRRKKLEEERLKALASAPPVPQVEATTTPSAEAETSTADTGLDPTPSLDLSRMHPDEYEPASAVPRILPPSTGEIVATERPGLYSDDPQIVANEPETAASEPATPAQDEAKIDADATGAGVTSESDRSEPAAHHG